MDRRSVWELVVAGRAGAVTVAEIRCPAGACYRPMRLVRLVRPDDRELYEIDVLVAGHVVVEQLGRRALLGPGDIGFVDPARPVRYRHDGTRHVTVLFPRRMLPLGPGAAAALLGTRLPGDHGVGALLSTMARQLPRHLDDLHGDAARLGAALVDLVAMALRAELTGGEPSAPGGTAEALLGDVYAFIDTHLGERDLDPPLIAAAHHVSLRYLHKLFQSQGTTVAGWVRRRRLERCRSDLLDPGLRGLTVGAVAARWGLPNAAHFSRAFKAEFGVAPAQYREIALSGCEPIAPPEPARAPAPEADRPGRS
ncbi:helix-turn-helix domain-containing protein [Dactylosporangium sp. CS-033363]|uniref:AraC-like ligand-binding domain-containing protein n=1 Tax=Dactylosporangium sp. CS-033363 TaxID=3239935 RepID=UPI003D94BE10